MFAGAMSLVAVNDQLCCTCGSLWPYTDMWNFQDTTGWNLYACRNCYAKAQQHITVTGAFGGDVGKQHVNCVLLATAAERHRQVTLKGGDEFGRDKRRRIAYS